MIGSGPNRDDLVARPSRDRRAGFEVVSSLSGPRADSADLDAWLNDVEDVIRDHNLDAVAVTQTPTINSEVIRRLSAAPGVPTSTCWSHPPWRHHRPRLAVRPAAGLPLLHLGAPPRRPQAIVKGVVFDF